MAILAFTAVLYFQLFILTIFQKSYQRQCLKNPFCSQVKTWGCSVALCKFNFQFSLGIEALIRPFQWPNVIIPVLPQNLLELLEAPFPFLIGSQNNQAISQIKSVIIVNLDEPDPSKQIVNQDLLQDVSEPHANGLKQKISKPYHYIHKREYNICFQPDQTQKIALQKIAKTVFEYWKSLTDILDLNILDSQNKEWMNFQKLSEKVIEKVNPGDKLFVEKFVTTQIFANYIS